MPDREGMEVTLDTSCMGKKTCEMFPKTGGKLPQMDGENNGKPLLKWMIWGVPLFSETSMFDPNLKMICLKDKIHGKNAKNANVLSYTRRISNEASTK